MFRVGWAPIARAFSDPEEQSVFYCMILFVFWVCLSLTIFLFLVAGNKVAHSLTQIINYLLGREVDFEQINDSSDEDEIGDLLRAANPLASANTSARGRRPPEQTPEPKKTR